MLTKIKNLTLITGVHVDKNYEKIKIVDMLPMWILLFSSLKFHP